MFTLEHFIWLGISIIVIVGMLFIQKRFKLDFNIVLNILLVVSVLSELTKTLYNMIPNPKGNGGMILDPGDLPLHLCSIQIIFMFALKYIKNENTREKLLGFMIPTMLLGAIAALFIPTIGVEFTNLQVYQFFIYHAFLIFFAIYLLKEKFVSWNWKVFVRNLAYLGLLAFVVTWLNSGLSGTLPRVNFMYLVYPPMENLPLLNLDNGWYVYFITLASCVIALMAIFHLIVILCTKKDEISQ